MGVQHHALIARQNSGVAHQVAADRKGRAWRKADADHRLRACIMESIDHADAVFQDRRFLLDQVIGWQAAIAFANAHRAARGVKAQSDLLRGGNRVIEPRAAGIKIEVI